MTFSNSVGTDLLFFTLCIPGIWCTLMLSSSPPTSTDDGHRLSVCPGTNITLTCSATSVGSLAWRGQERQIGVFVTRDPVSKVVIEGPYTMTLVYKDSDSMGTNFTSTLEVNVDSISNGTNISCEIFRSQMSLIIDNRSNPYNVLNVRTKNYDFTKNSFSFAISWDTKENEVVDQYNIQISTNYTIVANITTGIILEGTYNTPMNITVWAVNCAGPSAKVIEEVLVSGCGPPSPPLNGSVAGWTDSQVGAHFYYSCDDGLVLEGDSVATCSQSLQWSPSNEDVYCSEQSALMTQMPDPSITPVSSQTNPPLVIIILIVTFMFVIGIGTFLFSILVPVILKHRSKKQKLPNREPYSSNITGIHQTLSSDDVVSSCLTYDIIQPTRSLLPSDTIDNVGVFHQTTTESYKCHSPKISTNLSLSPLKTQKETYAQLLIEDDRQQNVKESSMLSLPIVLEEPVQYSEVLCSRGPTEPLHPSCQTSSDASNSTRHPLDQIITIDAVIQQLSLLTPHWWDVGEAVGLQQSTLKEISKHFKGDEKESFAEVINHAFVPNKTTWTEVAGICERAGFIDLAESLLDSYITGVLPVKIDESLDATKDTGRVSQLVEHPLNKEYEENEMSLSPTPSLPPPLAPEDIPLATLYSDLQ